MRGILDGEGFEPYLPLLYNLRDRYFLVISLILILRLAGHGIAAIGIGIRGLIRIGIARITALTRVVR